MREQIKKKKTFYLLFLLIWVVQMLTAFYFCTQKQGFHEDEYYTYYSTARTNGFYVEDGQWMERETYRNEFVVLPGQQFQYGLVKQVQSWDVHPPVYYWVFHTVASLVPGVFSKWIGLAVNLVFYGINICLLGYLSWLISGKNEKVTLLVTLFYGLTPAAFSGVVFIRMYEMLTAFVLLSAILHIKGLQKFSVKNVLLMMTVTYLGYLTQYYYFIFLFYLGFFFCCYLLWKKRSFRDCLIYGGSQLVAFGLAYLTYSSCLGQMFRGQRGAQATENFFDWSNTLERISFFGNLLDEYVFGKCLSVLILLILLLGLWLFYQKRRRANPERTEHKTEQKAGLGTAFFMLAFATAGYFLTVSKTALLLGDTSNRYQLPVYGMVVLLLFTLLAWMFGQMAIKGTYLWIMAGILCLIVDIIGLTSDRVVFLYPQDKEETAFARQQAQENSAAIYLYNEGADWCIWDVTNELLEYPAVYFASTSSEEPLSDKTIENADSLVVYVAQGEDVTMQLERILHSNEKLTGYEQKWKEKYCDVYYFH